MSRRHPRKPAKPVTKKTVAALLKSGGLCSNPQVALAAMDPEFAEFSKDLDREELIMLAKELERRAAVILSCLWRVPLFGSPLN